jgi:GNAT superfamily N-acetyltransferase
MRRSLNHLLPGRLRIERGTFADYRALEHFHYAPGRPAAPAGVWRVVYGDLQLSRCAGPTEAICDLQLKNSARHPSFNCKSQIANCKSRVVAVGVLAYPTPASRARERTLSLTGPRYGPKLAFVNRHVRTIARIIVHPQFRGLGVAARLVRRICQDCPTRYVEAFAAMGEVHPLFERGGMRRVAGGEGEAAYFIFDREEGGRRGE